MFPGDVVKRVRRMIFDDVAEYRFVDERVLDYINDGIREIRSMRPDATFDDDGEFIPFEFAIIYPEWEALTAYALNVVARGTDGRNYRVSTAGTTGAAEPTWDTIVDATTADGTAVWTAVRTDEIVLADKWASVLCHYASSFLFEEEFDNTSDGMRSNKHLEQFNRGVYTI
jgi:hypothetical protein